MAVSPTFGDLLRQHRLAAGLTQEALAERAGLSEHGIQKLERGVTRPYRDTVERLLAALRLSIDDQARVRMAAGPSPRAPRILAGVNGARHNLPIPVTSFIGREQEAEEISVRLSTARLLTLTGIGGCGKTRLAQEVARTLMENFADGVWLVELASVADGNLVPHIVANALGVREGTGQTVTDALIHALNNRRLLLVLDNCEHLLDACARMVDDLVRFCEHVQVLATSREALGLTEEVAWRVPSLAVPDEHQQFTLLGFGATAAVQLFVERAAAVQPGFELTERNASAIAQICRRLDGIPLALELAAARAQALTAEQIAARLDQRFRLLTGGSRAALPRQQTLRATLDWSYDLLREPERILLNRLCVFTSGWSLEAAEVVCADERIEQADVLDLLGHLVSKSLVLADEVGDGAKRYRLLETVRQYARERLVSSGEAEVLHERHAAYFLAFGEPFGLDVESLSRYISPRPDQLDMLERELDNLRSALLWLIETQDAERALRVTGVLYPVWFVRGYITEGHARLRDILDLPSARGSQQFRRRALPIFARLAIRHREYDVAFEMLQELLVLQQSAGNHPGAAWALIELANVYYLRAAYTAAWACLNASRSQGIDLGDHQLEVLWCNYGSMTALCEGRYDLARTLATAALTGWEAEHMALASAYCQMTLGNVDLAEGSYEAAHARFLRALRAAVDYADRTLLAHLLEGFSGLASALGQHDRAVRLGGAGDALREIAGSPIHPAWQHIAERWLVISRQALGDEAASHAWAAGRSLPIARALEELENVAEPTC